MRYLTVHPASEQLSPENIVKELGNLMGGEVVVQVNWSERDRVITAREVGKVRKKVRECGACGLREGCRLPVPLTLGEGRSDVVMLGEAPGVHEDQQNAPFVGPAGKLLRSMLPEYGEQFSWLNVVSCRPPENRPPTKGEIAACKGNLGAQLAAVNARYLLLLGATALSAFRTDLQVTSHRGYTFAPNGRFFAMATYHPALVLRNRDYKLVWKRDLGKFLDLVTTGYRIETGCIVCGRDAEAWDIDAVGYCSLHMMKGGNWKGDTKKARRLRATGQMSLGVEKELDEGRERMYDSYRRFTEGGGR